MRKGFTNWLHNVQSKSSPSSRASSPNPGFSSSSCNLSPANRVVSPSSDVNKGNQARPPSESLSSSIPPWVPWEVDSDSLCCIHQWNQEHQDDRFSTLVFKRVNQILECKVFEATLKFIPDNPIPAKSLVEALVSLTLLVTKIPEAKQEVCEFAKEVATDISLLADAFGASDSPLLNKAWDDLRATRDCVNDICKWASDQLPKTLSDASGLHQEVVNWRVKLAVAKSGFSERTLIRILKEVGTTSQYLGDINRVLQKLYRDDEIKDFMKSIETLLGNHVVPKAKYNAEGQKKREYNEETRKDVLNQITEWTNKNSRTARCMWVTGRAGVGKSTIGIEVAKKLEDERSLYAQFFVTRDIAHTTEPDNIFPTMAHQLAERFPLAAEVLHKKLAKVPLSRVKKFSCHEALAIFVEPLQTIAHYADKVVVIVDGVDELDNTDLFTLSEMTSVLCRVMHGLPPNVRILVLSRPETPIIENIPSDIDPLDLALENSKSDVKTMIRTHTKLHRLAKKYKWDDWPSPKQEQDFCECAGGHLGWAKSALAWIVEQILRSPQKEVMRNRAFADVLALRSTDLEHLYDLIFTRITPPEDSKLNHMQFTIGFQIVIGSLAVIQEPQTISTVANLVSFDLKSSGLDPFDIVDFLNTMSSIFTDGTDFEYMNSEAVPQAHKSVFEYLSDPPSHHSLLQLILLDHHSRMTKTCFRIFHEELCFNIGRIKTSHKKNEELSGSEMQPISPHIVYACKHVGGHLEKMAPDAFLSDIADFMENHFLQWLEVLSLAKEVDSAESTLHIMEKHVGEENFSLSFLIQDGITFVTEFKRPISASAPHIYISALPQSHFSSLIRQHYLPKSSHFLCVKGDVNMWDEGPASVVAASLFHDGTHIAAIFTDGTLRIIAVTTGVEICTQLMEHAYKVAVSSDGKLVALVSNNGLCLRNAKTGEEIKTFRFDIVGPGPLAFSPDGTCIAVACQAKICVFNVNTGEIPSSPFKGHEKVVLSVAYSPNSTQIVSGSHDNSVRVWDASNGSLVIRFNGHTSWDTVAFSSNGTHIAAGSVYDGTIKLWTVETCNSRRLKNEGSVHSLAFSQEHQFLVAVSHIDIRVWDLSTTRSSSKLVGTHVTRVPTSVAFFPDEKQIMSTSSDRTIRVWDGSEMEECGGNFDGYGRWILGEKGERLVWALSGVRHDRNTFVVGRHVDLEHFVHGEEWVNCLKPLALACKETNRLTSSTTSRGVAKISAVALHSTSSTQWDAVADEKDVVVLITGTTNNLGVYLLDILLHDGRVTKVYTLNRLYSSEKDIKARHEERFIDAGLDVAQLSDARLVFLEGDASRKDLGLSHEIYEEIQSRVNIIIHNAWRLDLRISLPSFEPNLRGTRQLVEFACTARHASSLRFLFTSSATIARPVDDPRDRDPGDTPSDSACVTERILAQSGLEFTSFRIGQISGGSPNGAWATTDWFPILVKTSSELSALPSVTGVTSWLPMHAVAQTLLDVALSTGTRMQPVVNIVHPRPVAWDSVILGVNDALVQEDVVKEHLAIVDFSEWIKLLEEKVGENSWTKYISGIRAFELLEFFGMIARAGNARQEGKEDREVGGQPTFSTEKLQMISATMKQLPSLGKEDAALWVKYWKDIGLFSR